MEGVDRVDRGILLVTVVLMVIGVIMVASASQVVAESKFSSPFFFLQRHALRVLMAIFVMFLFYKIPYSILGRFSLFIYLGSVVLLIAIFFWGHEVRSANRWLPMFNFALQPVEFAKVALVIFIASRISDESRNPVRFREVVLPIIVSALFMALLVALQPNVSNAVLIMIIAFMMLYIGGCKLLHIVPIYAGLSAIAFPFLYRLPVVQTRLQAFLNRTEYLKSLNWQVEQSLIAIGSGFLFGSGPGRGHQKFNFLPDPHTDFIYSIIGEEVGFLGTLLVLILFVYLFMKSLKVAREAPDKFSSLLVFGLGLMIFTTAIINISMALGIIPTAGMPLPFISYGGSSLIAACASMGMILNISSKRSAVAGVILQKKVFRRRGVYARRRTGARRRKD